MWVQTLRAPSKERFSRPESLRCYRLGFIHRPGLTREKAHGRPGMGIIPLLRLRFRPLRDSLGALAKQEFRASLEFL